VLWNAAKPPNSELLEQDSESHDSGPITSRLLTSIPTFTRQIQVASGLERRTWPPRPDPKTRPWGSYMESDVPSSP
jgi:hypothetical protein